LVTDVRYQPVPAASSDAFRTEETATNKSKTRSSAPRLFMVSSRLFSLDLVDATVFSEAGPNYNSRGAFCWEDRKNFVCADRCRKIPISIIDFTQIVQSGYSLEL